MTLLLVDLDNTLIDRDAAFRAAAAAFLAEHRLPAGDLSWLMGVDASGYAPREVVGNALIDRYGVPGAAVRALLDTGAADRVTLALATAGALATARATGWTCVIVTNGRTAQQTAKIRNTGLDRLVDGWVVSEAAGHKKPAPQIFHAAAAVAGLPLRDAWVIGDSPHADIAGAAACGLPSVWISAGRPWTAPGPRPTRIAHDAAAALKQVTAGRWPARP
ncbi:HAD family hydrolase [Actinoplanes flavus]|uniref:HAD family hydrolase n=1 Tax=Actinoplanes flavus TaxID=2820290 RepID=A0ABS3UJ54_9ACTN|nr:HAD-IA family hydrolase [Actinoplanes flavus]MBO3738818.1 HAD family hydrolase [Actinoplanes flavus]